MSAFNDRIKTYCRAHRIGVVLFSPADLDLRSGQLLQPDLFMITTPDGRPFGDWPEAGIPALVVEVLSPGTARYDRVTKRRRYQRSGVDTYWIVDVDARLVEVWRPADDSPSIIDDLLEWQPDPAFPPLRIDLGELFREIWGE